MEDERTCPHMNLRWTKVLKKYSSFFKECLQIWGASKIAKIKPKFLKILAVSYPSTNIKYFKVNWTSKYLIVLKIIPLNLLSMIILQADKIQYNQLLMYLK